MSGDISRDPRFAQLRKDLFAELIEKNLVHELTSEELKLARKNILRANVISRVLWHNTKRYKVIQQAKKRDNNFIPRYLGKKAYLNNLARERQSRFRHPENISASSASLKQGSDLLGQLLQRKTLTGQRF